MSERNDILYVASYADDASAAEDYEATKQIGDTAVVAAAVLGGGLGLVGGLFAPPLLAKAVES
jgi:hypothetical protein